MDSGDIPAPGRPLGFSADEVIVYGISLKRNGVVGVAVTNGGNNYGDKTRVVFNPPSAEAIPIIDDTGVIKQIVVIDPGKYPGPAAPAVSFANVGGGTNAQAVALLGSMAVLNLEKGKWNIGIQGIFDPKRNRVKELPDLAMVAVYGYAYEGHCYRFDKPRMIGFEVETEDKVEGPLGCGFDAPAPLGGQPWYEAWRLRSNQQIIEMGISVGRVAELILDANRPGRRPPNTYASDMMIAHRGGRLTSP